MLFEFDILQDYNPIFEIESVNPTLFPKNIISNYINTTIVSKDSNGLFKEWNSPELSGMEIRKSKIKEVYHICYSSNVIKFKLYVLSNTYMPIFNFVLQIQASVKNPAEIAKKHITSAMEVIIDALNNQIEEYITSELEDFQSFQVVDGFISKLFKTIECNFLIKNIKIIEMTKFYESDKIDAKEIIELKSPDFIKELEQMEHLKSAYLIDDRAIRSMIDTLHMYYIPSNSIKCKISMVKDTLSELGDISFNINLFLVLCDLIQDGEFDTIENIYIKRFSKKRILSLDYVKNYNIAEIKIGCIELIISGINLVAAIIMPLVTIYISNQLASKNEELIFNIESNIFNEVSNLIDKQRFSTGFDNDNINHLFYLLRLKGYCIECTDRNIYLVSKSLEKCSKLMVKTILKR